jgi:S-adenosylmethionine hydrolase
LKKLNLRVGDSLDYIITEDNEKRLEGKLPFVRTFGEVEIEQPLTYIDSSGKFGFSINRGNFSNYFQVYAGLNWEVHLKRSESDSQS